MVVGSFWSWLVGCHGNFSVEGIHHCFLGRVVFYASLYISHSLTEMNGGNIFAQIFLPTPAPPPRPSKPARQTRKTKGGGCSVRTEIKLWPEIWWEFYKNFRILQEFQNFKRIFVGRNSRWRLSRYINGNNMLFKYGI